jgi:hypothetical protein
LWDGKYIEDNCASQGSNKQGDPSDRKIIQAITAEPGAHATQARRIPQEHWRIADETRDIEGRNGQGGYKADIIITPA